MIKSSKQKPTKNPKNTNSSAVLEYVELNLTDDSEKALRPKQLVSFVGQTDLKNQLNIIIGSAKIRNVMPEHMLFFGPAGLGKTTISNLIALEIGANFRAITASSLQKVGDIVALLSNLEPKTVLFIDEIHRLKAPLEESLYSAMEDGKIDILIGKGNGATTLRLDLPEITIVGATTLPGRLSKPLRDRFPSTFQLELYSHKEIKELINQNLTKLKLLINQSAIDEIAMRSRGTPRITNNILKRFLDLKLVNNYLELDLEHIFSFFDQLGIYHLGLTKSDLKYLRALKDNQLSLKTLSGVLMEEVDTIEQITEPYLLYLGFVDKDSNGRKITYKGLEYLEIIKATLE
jgi:holliday junction DNA helicase RuvB